MTIFNLHCNFKIMRLLNIFLIIMSTGFFLMFNSCEDEKNEFTVPELDIMFPSNGAWVEGSFNVAVLVSSTVRLSEIELIVNDQLTAMSSVSDTSRILWDTRDFSDGSFSPMEFTLYARARLSNVQVFYSDTVNVTALFPRQLTFNPSVDIQPQWNNEGSSIIFKSNREMADSLYQVYSVTPDGEAPVLIATERIYHGYPGWSPDGEHVVFNSYDIETDQWWGDMNIFTANISTGETHQVTVDSLFDDSGRWSPDGNWISFHSTRSGNKDVWKIPVTSDGIVQGDPVRMTFGSGDEECARWSQDGDWLAFEYTHHGGLDYGDGFGNIGMISVEGGEVISLTDDNFNNGYPNWSPDGQLIVYNSKRFGEKDIFIRLLDGGYQKRITMSTGVDEHASWSSDGNYIAFASDRSENKDIWIVEIPDTMSLE